MVPKESLTHLARYKLIMLGVYLKSFGVILSNFRLNLEFIDIVLS